MLRVYLSISSPNERGMHIYAKNLFRLIGKNNSPFLNFPKLNKKFKKFQFLNQIFWELKPLKKEVSFENDRYISVHPRYPLNLLFNSNFLQRKKGIVICDYMQCLNFLEIQKNLSLIRNSSIIEIIKMIYHTIFFKLTVERSDFLIYISHNTKKELKNWIHKDIINQKPQIVIHPLPSFDPKKVLIQAKKLEIKSVKRNEINLLFVSGTPSTKRSHMILPIIKEVANYLENYRFMVNILGGIPILRDDIPKNLKIFSPKKSILEYKLIEIYLKTDIFISTSINEGFGIPLLDAMNFDIHCIASDIKAYKEINQYYGNNKLNLIPTNANYKDYAKAVSEILKKSLLSNKSKTNLYCERYERIFTNSENKLNKFLNNFNYGY